MLRREVLLKLGVAGGKRGCREVAAELGRVERIRGGESKLSGWGPVGSERQLGCRMW